MNKYQKEIDAAFREDRAALREYIREWSRCEVEHLALSDIGRNEQELTYVDVTLQLKEGTKIEDFPWWICVEQIDFRKQTVSGYFTLEDYYNAVAEEEEYYSTLPEEEPEEPARTGESGPLPFPFFPKKGGPAS